MTSLLPFIVSGLVVGSTYGLAGVGLVLTYKTARIFNFAHGALATAAAFLFFFLWVDLKLEWGVAAVIVMVVAVPVMGIVLESFARRLSKTTLVWHIVATVGVLLSIEAICVLLFGNGQRLFPHFLSINTFNVFDTGITYEQLTTVIISLAATTALYVLLRTSRTGKAMRAVVDDPELLELMGTSASRVRRLAWIVGAGTAAVAGLLLAPSTGLNAEALTLLVITAFAAAAIGRFSSLPVTYLGGLIVGVASSLVTKYVSTTSVWSGLSSSLPFIMLFVVLIIFPKRWLQQKTSVLSVRPIAWQLPVRLQLTVAIPVLLGLILVPKLVGFRLSSWTVFLAYVVLFLSLDLLVRTSGQISLCHLGFAAIGAVAMSKFVFTYHVPWLAGLLLAGLVAVPIGLLLAIPAVRLGGLYLALATFGFGLVLAYMFYNSTIMFGFSGGGLNVPMPSAPWLGIQSSTSFYYLVLVVAVLVALLVALITNTRLGRILRGLAESPTVMEASGTSTSVTRVIAFSISAFIAAVAGALIASALQFVNGSSFDPMSSLTIVVILMIVTAGAPWNALIAAGAFILIPAYIQSGNINTYLQCFIGLGAIAAALGLQGGVPHSWRSRIDTLPLVGRQKRELATSIEGVHVDQPPFNEDESTLIFRIDELTVRFGGLVAVNGVSLHATGQRITGLIGPNGAGKTTVFNACSGLVKPSSGRVYLGDSELTSLSPAARARHGLGRSFQRVDLCEGLSVRDNVALGREAYLAGRGVISHILTTRKKTQELREAVGQALAECGISELADRQVSMLTTGQRRMVELARILMGPHRMLMLDEPSSGLDSSETQGFGEVLRRLVAERGLGILLVEHDMSLMMSLCDHIYVMDFGKLIFEGSPNEVNSSREVQAAYLGDLGSTLGQKEPHLSEAIAQR